jgi:hypothetical protein
MSVEEVMNIIMREAENGRLDLKVARTMGYLAPEWEVRRREDPALQGPALASDSLLLPSSDSLVLAA